MEGQRLTDKRHPAVNCGCMYRKRSRDVTSETHGGVCVIRQLKTRSTSGDVMYIVKCLSCGKEREMPRSQIMSAPESCGCIKYSAESMKKLSDLAVKAAIVDGVNINSVFKSEANATSKTGVRGVFPERRNGRLTGTFRAAVRVHGECRVKTGFISIDSAKKWRDSAQEELLSKYKVQHPKQLHSEVIE